MDHKVTGKCFVKQESGLVNDDAGNKLPVKSVMFFKMPPFVITEEEDTNNFTGGEMEAIHQADDQFFEFFEGQVKKLQMERSHSIITSVFQALRGSRYKTRRMQVTGIPPMPVTMGYATPVTTTDTKTTTVPPIQVEITPEPLIPVPVAEVPMQPPMVDSQLGGSYITNM